MLECIDIEPWCIVFSGKRAVPQRRRRDRESVFINFVCLFYPSSDSLTEHTYFSIPSPITTLQTSTYSLFPYIHPRPPISIFLFPFNLSTRSNRSLLLLLLSPLSGSGITFSIIYFYRHPAKRRATKG